MGDAVVVTEEACQDGGGTYESYTCEDAQTWLNMQLSDPQPQPFHHSTLEYLATEQFKPKCCRSDNVVFSETSPDDEEASKEESTVESSVTGRHVVASIGLSAVSVSV